MEHTWTQLRDIMNWDQGQALFASSSRRARKASRFRAAMTTHLNLHHLKCRADTKAYSKFKMGVKFQDWLSKNRKSKPA
jgi:hypothetical protein